MTQRLTLRLIRSKGYEEQESKFISVDLPGGATEDDLRMAFAHVEERVVVDAGVLRMDAAADLVAGLIESREAVKDRQPPPVESRIADAMPEHPLNRVRSIDEQRSERAEEQAAYVQPPESTVSRVGDPLGSQSADAPTPEAGAGQ